MDKKLVESLTYIGKIGVDNALLILLGIEHLVLFWLKWLEGQHYKRIWLYVYEGVFFIGYGFFNDIYRMKALRKIILNYSLNFVYINSIAILIFGLPLLVRISLDIQNILIARRKTRYVKQQEEIKRIERRRGIDC